MIAPQTAPVPSPETDRTTRLTPLGEAARLVFGLRRAVADLGPDDRAAIVELLAQEFPPTV